MVSLRPAIRWQSTRNTCRFFFFLSLSVVRLLPNGFSYDAVQGLHLSDTRKAGQVTTQSLTEPLGLLPWAFSAQSFIVENLRKDAEKWLHYSIFANTQKCQDGMWSTGPLKVGERGGVGGGEFEQHNKTTWQ